MSTVLRTSSTNIVDIPDLYDMVAQVFLTGANATPVSGALLDAAKVALSPAVPLTWAYVAGTQGTWRAAIADTVVLTDGATYYARLKISTGSPATIRQLDVKCTVVGTENP